MALGIVASFLKQYPDGGVMYFDSESAVTKSMFEERGIPSGKVVIIEPETLEDFRNKAFKIIAKYLEIDQKKRKPLIFVLDSLSMLPSQKETEDAEKDATTRDMTKSQIIRGAFRLLTLKLGKANIPMIVTAHQYDVIGAYVPTKEVSGGKGLIFAASTIASFSKKSDKDDGEVNGVFITSTMKKSRFTREQTKVQAKLSFETGLDRYYGLLELAEEGGIVKKVGTRYEFPTGEKVFEKAVYKAPQKYFTKEILDQIDEYCGKKFKYGKGEVVPVDDEVEEEGTEE